MEIVSEPDIRSAEEAGAYVEKVRSIMRYLETCDGNMQEGSLRADVNVSVRRPGSDFGTPGRDRTANSIRFIRQAIDYEAQRQIEVIEDGGAVTRKLGCSIPSAAKRGQCAQRKKRMTTGISRIPICCRWNLSRVGLMQYVKHCRSCRTAETPFHSRLRAELRRCYDIGSRARNC